MATIKAIEQRSVHQIQAGQVIVDLCSVVKELVENSLDAGASSLDVRFRNHGLESIEVQDNGDGISPENYENVALKHHTSKLSEYADLDNLQTFGFRGEALSSLCAVSSFYMITSRAEEAPRGSRLDFEVSGKLKGTQVVHSQKGTTAVVEGLFRGLPVRRRELEKNIKREYGKVLALLQAYACISTGVKFTVSNHMQKGKKAVVFATKGNKTTQENVMNVFGAKTVMALIPLDLKMELQSSRRVQAIEDDDEDEHSGEVRILGHISRPAYGEGRQTPQRQMLFVNGRPCGLPQVTKAFNEAHKSYNVTHSPFILANLSMDTNAYDVNVSPDKRTILLHEQSALLEAIKTSVTELLERHEQTMPQTPLHAQKQHGFKQLSITRTSTVASDQSSPIQSSEVNRKEIDEEEDDSFSAERPARTKVPRGLTGNNGDGAGLLQGFISARSMARDEHDRNQAGRPGHKHRQIPRPRGAARAETGTAISQEEAQTDDDEVDVRATHTEPDSSSPHLATPILGQPIVSADRLEMEPQSQEQGPILSVSPRRTRQLPGPVQSAFNSMRSKRLPADTATITIGSKTVVSPLRKTRNDLTQQTNDATMRISQFASQLQTFSASASTSKQAVPSGAEVEFRSPDSENRRTPQRHGQSDAEDKSVPIDSDGVEEPQVRADRASKDRAHVLDISGPGIAESRNVSDAERKASEEAKVQALIREAETRRVEPTKHRVKAFKSGGKNDTLFQLMQTLHTSAAKIDAQLTRLSDGLQKYVDEDVTPVTASPENDTAESAEERLSLSVSKEDFRKMKLVGQFNLGFILATRPSEPNTDGTPGHSKGKDELFIIDQHASDEIYNFERLQRQTVVQNQRLVRPRKLDLTAIEEEIVLENKEVLEKNGFLVEIDQSGDEPIGRRCTLTSLPMSREVVFDTRDLEELLALLMDAPPQTSGSAVIRPSKVRRMFAMRACRSSIMIGHTLTAKQMRTVVRHMGEIDKPWNCPHGRPTMRHLMSLDDWEPWEEGDGVVGLRSEDEGGGGSGSVDWAAYVGGRGAS